MQQKKQNEVTTAKKYAEYRREKENGKRRAHQPHAPKWLKNPLTWAALTVALATIERIHPGSYEKLIKENAQSAA